MASFAEPGIDPGSLSRLSDAVTRSISAENPTGAKGIGGMATGGSGAHAARDLGQGWKVRPSVILEPGQTFTFAEIEGPGAIQSMWLCGKIVRRGAPKRDHCQRIDGCQIADLDNLAARDGPVERD